MSYQTFHESQNVVCLNGLWRYHEFEIQASFCFYRHHRVGWRKWENSSCKWINSRNNPSCPSTSRIWINTSDIKLANLWLFDWTYKYYERNSKKINKLYQHHGFTANIWLKWWYGWNTWCYFYGSPEFNSRGNKRYKYCFGCQKTWRIAYWCY